MAGIGPLPNPNRVRRNKAAIPTTVLPASGREGPAPDLPEGCLLGEAGLRWWAWAWATPQACGWSDGDEYVVWRRASFEDDLVRVEQIAATGAARLAASGGEDLAGVAAVVSSMAAGRISVARVMLELDDRLGLTPKGMAALRWKIIGEEPVAASGPKEGLYGHLRSVPS